MKQHLIAATVLIACFCSCGENKEKKPLGQTKVTANILWPNDSQVIFTLSMISNLPASLCWNNNGIIDTISAADSIISYVLPIMNATLQNATDPNNPNLNLSDWHIVWGPAVIAGRGDSSLNYERRNAFVPVSSMTIFQSTSNPGNYVVGVEATNPYCPYDWDTLDLNVSPSQMIQWSTGNTAQGSLSRGTWLGLNNFLLKLTDNNLKTTAVAFLDTVLSKNAAANIVVTGHSLGGALSPVFALYLKQNNMSANIYCMSTAGPSPGDTVFCKYYNSLMAGSTLRVWNYLDVVPRAWNVGNMEYIKSGGIYSATGKSVFFDSTYSCDTTPQNTLAFNGKNTPADICLMIDHEVAVSCGTLIPKSSNCYGYVCGGGTYFTGTGSSDSVYLNIAPGALSKWYEKIFAKNDDTFLSQVGNQHVAAYLLHYNMKGIHEYMRAKVHGCKYCAANWTCTYPSPSRKRDYIAPGTPGFRDFWAAIHKRAWK